MMQRLPSLAKAIRLDRASLLVFALALAACNISPQPEPPFAGEGDMSGPTTGTASNSPDQVRDAGTTPLLVRELIDLTADPTMPGLVDIVGRPGAAPPMCQVVATNLASLATASSDVQPDGSFRLEDFPAASGEAVKLELVCQGANTFSVEVLAP